MPWSSNATYLVRGHDAATTPSARSTSRGRGERPLWDFPSGLDHREVAAFELSEALGWDLVPADHPARRAARQGLAPGVRRRRLRAALLHALRGRGDHHDQLRAMCAFDLVGNNTDRKSGHCLLGLDGRIRGIDHGLMFHHEFKLRTVIWEFGGEPVPARPARGRRRRSPMHGLPDALGRAARPLRARRGPDPGASPRASRAASRSTRPAAATPGRSSRPARTFDVASASDSGLDVADRPSLRSR